MSVVPIHRSVFFRISSHGKRNHHHHHHQTSSASWKMTMDSQSSQTRKKEELSVEHQKNSKILQIKTTSPSNLCFNRLQTLDQEFTGEDRIEFGQFVAREALLDEEYWEFNALKRRCNKNLHTDKCTCIITVKKEERNVKRSVLKSVVGTLDLSIQYLLPGENFPGQLVKAHLFCSIGQNRYGYIANLCVAKSARRQGIARNMLHFAVHLAKSNGAEEVFVHVHRKNRPAQELYQKSGFQVVEMATAQLSKEQTYLLCFK